MTEKLFTPITIGNVTIKNRVIQPSMCVFFAEEEGSIGDAYLAYVDERVRGGVGMIIIPGSPHGKVGPGRPAMSDDKYLPGWKKLVETVHQYGAKLFCQLHPANLQAGRGFKIEMPADYTVEEIKAIVASYAACAERCKRVGVDGVEIHGAHAHEVAQFMSPLYNTRTDEYGGSLENRARFPMEIVKAIKEACGKEYPLIFRMSGDEGIEGGRRIQESAEIAKLVESVGADAIHVSRSMPESAEYASAPMSTAEVWRTASASHSKSSGPSRKRVARSTP